MTPKQVLGTYFAASCEILYPPLRGIVQLTNFPTLRYGNWSFTNKVKTASKINFFMLLLTAVFPKEFPGRRTLK